MGIFDLARQVGRLQGQKENRDRAIKNALNIGEAADAGRARRRSEEREDERNKQKSILDILKQKREDARREEDVEERLRDNERQERQMKQSQEQYEQTQANINRRHKESLDAQKERKYTIEMSKGAKEVSDRAFDAAKDSSRDLNKYAKGQAKEQARGAKEVSDRAFDAAKDSARDLNKYRREQRESATELTTRAVDAPRDVLERAKAQAKGVEEVGDRAVDITRRNIKTIKRYEREKKVKAKVGERTLKRYREWKENFEFDNDHKPTSEETNKAWKQFHDEEDADERYKVNIFGGGGGQGGSGQDKPFRALPGQTPVAFDYPGSTPIPESTLLTEEEFEEKYFSGQAGDTDPEQYIKHLNEEYSRYKIAPDKYTPQQAPLTGVEESISPVDFLAPGSGITGSLGKTVTSRIAKKGIQEIQKGIAPQIVRKEALGSKIKELMELAASEPNNAPLQKYTARRLAEYGQEISGRGYSFAEDTASASARKIAIKAGEKTGEENVLDRVKRAKEVIAEGKQGLKGLNYPDTHQLTDFELGMIEAKGMTDVQKQAAFEEMKSLSPEQATKSGLGTDETLKTSDEMILARNAMEGPGSPTMDQLKYAQAEGLSGGELREAIEYKYKHGEKGLKPDINNLRDPAYLRTLTASAEELVELKNQLIKKQQELPAYKTQIEFNDYVTKQQIYNKQIKEIDEILLERGTPPEVKFADEAIDAGPVGEIQRQDLLEAMKKGPPSGQVSRFQLGAVGNLGDIGKVPGGVATETKNFIGKVREFVADSNVPGDPAQFAADMIKKNPEAPFLGGQDAKIVFGPFDPRSVALLFPKIANMAQPQVLKMLRSLDAELTKIDGIVGGLKPGGDDSLALGKWLVGKTDQLPDHLRGLGDAIRGKMNELLLRYKYGHAAIPQPTTRVEYPTGGSQTKLVEDILGPGKKTETVTRDVPLRTTREVETTYPAGGKQGSLFPDILGPESKLEPSQLAKRQQIDAAFEQFSDAISRGDMEGIREFQAQLMRIHGTNPEELINFATHGDQKKLFDDLLGNLTKKETVEGTEVLKKVEQVESNYPTGVLEQMRLVADKLGPKVKTEAPTPLRKFIEVTSDFSEQLSTNDDAVEIIESLTRLVSRKEHLGQTLKDIKAEIKKMAPGPDATRREKIIHDMQKWYLDSYVNALGGKPNALISPTRIVDSFLELFGAKPNSASRFFIAGKMMASRAVLGLRVASAQTNALMGALNAASQGKLAKGLSRWWAEGGKTLSGETLKEMGYTSPIFPRQLGKIRDASFLGLVDKDTGKAIDRVLYGPLNAGTSATAGARYWSAVEEFMEKAPKGLTKDTITKRAHEFGLIEAQKVQNLGAHGFEAPIYDDPIISAALQFTRPMWDQFDVAVRQNLVKAAKGNREPLLKFLAYTGGVIGLVGASGYGDTKEATAKLYDFLMPWKGPARTQTFGPMTQGFDAAQQFIQNLAGDVTRKEAYKGSAEAVFSNLAPAGKQINEAREQFMPTEEEAKQEKTLAAGTKRTSPGTGERFKRAFGMFRTPQEEAEERLGDASNIKDDVLRKMRIKQRRKELNQLGVKTKP